jgi:hypothetical protein
MSHEKNGVSGLESYLGIVLIANGAGDLLLGLAMVFLPGLLGRLMDLDLNLACFYLAGGWGVAAIAFGALRIGAGLSARIEIRWFAAVFGVVEGVLLTVFSLVLMAVTPLSLAQVSLSTLFAGGFAGAYAVAFIRRSQARAS